VGGSTSMTLMELKDFINEGTRPSDFMIFIRKDCPFLTTQYIKELEKLTDEGINKISSIYEPLQSSIALLATPEDSLNILKTETFDERAENYSIFENTIVICDQVDKSIVNSVEKYIIKFPKLEEWQILDYTKTICPGLDEDELTWLIKATNADIERIVNELDKVSLFDKAIQKEIFSAIRFDPQTDLYNIDLFMVVNALVDGNTSVLYEFLLHNNYESLDPVMLSNRALTSLKNIILVTQNPMLRAEDFGISAGQYNFLKRNYRNLNLTAAKEKLKFLTKFDLDLKTSKLELNKRDILNYLISHLFYKITV
jgi:hypothetical protein